MEEDLERNRSLHFKPDRRGARRDGVTPRRASDRLYGPCVATMKGIDANGQTFREDVTLEDVSACGLFLKIKRNLMLGARVFIVFAFSAVGLRGALAPVVAVRGVVRRVVAQPNNLCGVGVSFQNYRFV